MHTQSRAGRVGVVLFVLLIAASVGFMAYRVGFGHGVAQGITMNLAAAGPEAAKAAPNALPNAPLAPYGPYPHPYPYGWHGHWGWGWGFFPFGFLGPFLLVGFWFFVMRMLFWGGPRGPWRRGWYDGHRHDADPSSRHARL